MSANKDQKRQKDNPKDKNNLENKKGTFKAPLNNPKPFQQFSNPNKFSGGAPKSFNAFHRRLGK
ncbi:MAG: hypothetical protein A3B68_02315 [Candidatus Melainabacteria bacterium RIFCSPHIGHO2_02_FULL_34_12]|nr:MAG: hypothetical protein A3B68_02315 [Candidatus Melainabacteria bacterium RIFCSPHIGHO2_02_FULL_34_12]